MLTRAKDSSLRVLRWSERYTGTDMVYLARGGGWYLLGTLASWLISLCTVLAFANLLPKETYGIYQYVLSVADLFGIMVLGGIDSALARSVARGQEGSLMEGLFSKVRWGLVGGAGSILLGAYYIFQGNALLGWAFIIVGVAIPFWEAPGLFVAYLQGKRRFGRSAVYGVATQLIAAVVIIPTLFLTHNLLLILAAYLASWGAGRAFFFWLTVRHFPPNSERDPGMITYGKHLTVMSLVGTLASSADDILLFHFLGASAVAMYVFALALPTQAASLIKIVNRVAFPKMAATTHEDLKRTLPRKVFLLVWVGVAGALAYIVLAPFIFELLFRQYLPAVPYTQLFAALIALQPFNLFSTALSAQAKTAMLYLYNFAVPGVRIALLFALIPRFGVWGAVFAVVITDVFDSAISTGLFYWA